MTLEEALSKWTIDDQKGDPDRKKALITSALPYVNNVPHLGNIIGSLLSADVFARYCRLRDRETLFVCGTDEYGTATETKAMEEGISPEEICSKYHAIHREVYEWFNLSFDHFGRTSTQYQTEICQDLFWKLYKKGYIYEESVDQLYCTACKMFLADRFVEGTCPLPACSYSDARGDQCDKCGQLINAPDLKDPRCKVCSSSPELRTSKHLFLDLPKLEPDIKKWYDDTVSKESCCWTQTARIIAAAWLKEGLQGRCITRDLKWGTPVPLKGFEDKVFYVWFDAPIGYLSITRGLIEDWESWWKNPDEVELYQFMAKDNVLFHSIIMPATQLGSGDNFTLVNHLMAVEYLNYEDDKFSKSRGVGVFGNDAKDTGIPSDIWRFYLIFIRPETSDSSFNWCDLQTRNNSELLNNLGNFFNRALAFLFNNFEGVIQSVTFTEEDNSLIESINTELEVYLSLMDKGKLRDALRKLLDISRLGNQHMQSNKPWELIKKPESKERAGSVISLLTNVTALLSLLLSPFIPESTDRLRQQLNLSVKTFKGQRFIQLLKPGHKINQVSLELPFSTCSFLTFYFWHNLSLQPSPLFRKIENKEITELQTKFAGKTRSSSNSTVKANAINIDGKSEDEIALLITAQGDKIRSLKASKAEKTVITQEVQVLKDLKAGFEKVSGKAFDPPRK